MDDDVPRWTQIKDAQCKLLDVVRILVGEEHIGEPMPTQCVRAGRRESAQ